MFKDSKEKHQVVWRTGGGGRIFGSFGALWLLGSRLRTVQIHNPHILVVMQPGQSVELSPATDA